MTINIAKWTLAEYHQLVATGILSDAPGEKIPQRRVELLEGLIVDMEPAGIPHAVHCSESVEYLRTLLKDRAEVREGHPITLSNNSEPKPDITAIRFPNSQYLNHHPYPADIFWPIEYADTTLDKDVNIKKRVYAEAGIQEYWVVNLQIPELIVFRDLAVARGEGYANCTYRSETKLVTGNISPLSFPDLQIEVSKLLSV